MAQNIFSISKLLAASVVLATGIGSWQIFAQKPSDQAQTAQPANPTEVNLPPLPTLVPLTQNYLSLVNESAPAAAANGNAVALPPLQNLRLVNMPVTQTIQARQPIIQDVTIGVPAQASAAAAADDPGSDGGKSGGGGGGKTGSSK